MKYIEIYVKQALSKSKLQNTDFALNPYKGCEHRCIYCYSPYVLHIPLEKWNSIVYIKRNIPTVLNKELKRKKGHVEIGTVTDAYQPAERKYEITRKCLEVLERHKTSISILTKSSLILRDRDLLEKMNAEVGVTITTTDENTRKRIEPYASPIQERLQVLEEFSKKLKTYTFIGPIFPEILMNDLEDLLLNLKKSGVSYVIFDKFRKKEGMSLPTFLKPQNYENYENIKIKIKKIAKKIDIPHYFDW